MSCPVCQRENPADARFCNGCGQPLARICAACARENPPDASFCAGCGARLDGAAATPTDRRIEAPRSYTPPHLADRILRTRGALEGERKNVTVLFCDLADSTPLAEGLGAEEMHRVMDRAFGVILDEVHRTEGTVNQFLGDGAMALFGAPLALEDASRRAVRAALAIQRRLAPLDDELRERVGVGFRMRIGIHTGPVVVGRIGDDLRMDYTAVGETTNLAARLEALAEPGSVVVSGAVEALVRGLFELRDLGEQAVKGLAHPVRCHEVVAEHEVRSRLEASAARGLSPLVGREHDLATLETAFAAAEQGRGQVVFLVGEAGIGKSRLLYELRERLGERASLWLEGRCASYAARTPFHALADGLRRTCGIEDRDADSAALAKLDALAGSDADAWMLPPLRALLALPSGSESFDALPASSRRGEIFRALRGLLHQRAERGPVILAIEDLHWIDAASEEFLGYLLDSIPATRLLVLLTHRPGYAQPFGDRSYYARVTLRPLSAQDTSRLASAALQVGELPGSLLDAIAAKAEGNPFFVEEVTRSMVEEGVLRREADRLELARGIEDIAIPDRIQDVLMARIDRLAEEPKRALQVASVIGREFALRLLERIAEAGDRVPELIGELRAVELVHEKAAHPELAFMFKHALTHGVAYESVLVAQRKALHRVVGRAIEELYADRLGEHYEALAHHFERAESWDKAFHYHRLAAQKAAASYANQAAIAHCQEALALIEAGRVAVGRAEHHDLEALLGASAFSTNELTLSAEAWERAAALSEDPEQAGLELGRGAYSLYWCHEFDRMHAMLDRMIEFAEANDLPAVRVEAGLIRAFYGATNDGRLEPLAKLSAESVSLTESTDEIASLGHFLFGECAEWRGDFAQAQEHTGRSIELARRVGRPEFGFAAEWFRGKAVIATGRYVEAARDLGELLDRVERSGDRALRTRVLNTLGWCHAEAGDHLRAAELNRRSVELARELIELELVAGAPEIRGNASINLAINHLALGDAEAADAHLAPVREYVEGSGDPWMMWRYSMHLWDVDGRLALACREPDRALALAETELEAARAHAVRKLEGRAQELRGRALLALDRRDEAEAALRKTIAISRELGYRPTEWRAWALLGELARRRSDAAGHREQSARMRVLLERTASEAGGTSFAVALRATAERLVADPEALY
jgi:class 3 adenylate cyclase/tetratricopeptide (TPR) repeat protein